MKYAHYDPDTRTILGYYTPEVHGKAIPIPHVEITDERWQQALSEPGTTVNAAGDDVVPPPLPDPDVVEARRRAAARGRIDRAAGAARQRFVSPGALIDAEYVQAETAAQAYADAVYPADAVPPAVQSWADATGMTPQQAADNILATAQQWRGLLDQIRAIRLMGKAAVGDAADADIEATAKAYIDQLDAMAPA